MQDPDGNGELQAGVVVPDLVIQQTLIKSLQISGRGSARRTHVDGVDKSDVVVHLESK